MGRPLNKSKLSVTTGGNGEAGKIEVTGYFPAAGSLLQDDNAYIVSQRSSRKFKIHQADSTLEVMNLRAVAPASLTAGQFCVRVILDDSTVAFVEKFYNNVVSYRVNSTDGLTDGTTGRIKYTLGTAANGEDSTPLAGQGVIDVI
jgi:hypothetical protein